MAENLIAGGSIGTSFKKTLSEKSKARMMGIKEAFDPLNMVKKLTGGSKLAPAILGKMLGRSKQDLEYFAGDPRKRKLDTKTAIGFDEETLQKSTESLGNIYNLLKKDRDNKIAQRERKQSFEKAVDKQEELRNKELIKALTARKKKKEVPKKEEKPKEEAPAKPPAGKPPTVPKKGAPGKAPAKAPEAPKPPAPKPPAKAPEAPKPSAPKPAEAPKPPAPKPAEAPKPPAKVPETRKPKAEPVKPAPKPTAEKPAAPKPEAKPPTAAPAPKPEVKPPTAAPVAKPSVLAGKLGGAAGVVISALASAGLSSKAQANVLAQVKSESNFVPKSESLFYTKAEGIQNTFGKGRIPTLEFAQQFVSKKGDDRSEQLANHVYAKTDGNSAPGDGWKYRGRGLLQITGKNAYKALGDYLKIDLVSNPDLLNTPEIAAKSIPWFFLSYKKNLTKGDPKSLEDVSLVNRAVGFADDKVGSKAKKRAELASEIESMDLNSGSQIDQASKENKDLKAASEKDRPANIVNNNVTTQTKKQPSTPPPVGDDRPAYMKKFQGQ
jgi:predicted chitinase